MVIGLVDAAIPAVTIFSMSSDVLQLPSVPGNMYMYIELSTVIKSEAGDFQHIVDAPVSLETCVGVRDCPFTVFTLYIFPPFA